MKRKVSLVSGRASYQKRPGRVMSLLRLHVKPLEAVHLQKLCRRWTHGMELQEKVPSASLNYSCMWQLVVQGMWDRISDEASFKVLYHLICMIYIYIYIIPGFMNAWYVGCCSCHDSTLAYLQVIHNNGNLPTWTQIWNCFGRSWPPSLYIIKMIQSLSRYREIEILQSL